MQNVNPNMDKSPGSLGNQLNTPGRTSDIGEQAMDSISKKARQAMMGKSGHQAVNDQVRQIASSLGTLGSQTGQIANILGNLSNRARQATDPNNLTDLSIQTRRAAERLDWISDQVRLMGVNLGSYANQATPTTITPESILIQTSDKQMVRSLAFHNDQAAELLRGKQAKSSAGGVKEQTSGVKDLLGDRAKQVTGNVSDQMSGTIGKLGGQAKQAASSMRDQVGKAMDKLSRPGKQTEQTEGRAANQTRGGRDKSTEQAKPGSGGFVGRASEVETSIAVEKLGRGIAGTRSSRSTSQTLQAGPTVLFNTSEWKTLVETPLKVEMAMVMASPSSTGGVMQEMLVIWREAHGLMYRRNQNPLLKSVGQQMKNMLDAEPDSKQFPYKAFSSLETERFEDARGLALAACKEAAYILRKAPLQDAKAYKEYVYTSAQSVAEAARAQSSLGFKGDQVSREEVTLLAEVAEALGLDE